MDVGAFIILGLLVIVFGLFFIYVIHTNQLQAFWAWLSTFGNVKPVLVKVI